MSKLTYERAKQLYTPYDEGQMRHLCALRDVEIDRLRAENAKLRDELVNAPKCESCEAMLDCDECLRADGSHKERRRLSADNAKLRELVSDMWEFFCVVPEDEPHVFREELDFSVEVWRRMRELGVEVDA